MRASERSGLSLMPITIQSFDCAFKPTRSGLRDWCLLVRRPKIFFSFFSPLKKREGEKMRDFLVIIGKTKTIIPPGVLFFYFFLSRCSLNRVSQHSCQYLRSW